MITVPKDLTGIVFGQLTVLGRSEDEMVNGFPRAYWNCQCKCGKSVRVWGQRLNSGRSRTCGCRFNSGRAGGNVFTHGLGGYVNGKQHPIYRAWKSMHMRCSAKSKTSWRDYGSKGVVVCDRWGRTAQGVKNFYADMAPTWKEGLTLDRYPNNNGNYEPGNVRWCTMKEQQRNRRNNVLLTGNGKTQCISAWEEELDLEPNTLRRWLHLKIFNP